VPVCPAALVCACARRGCGRPRRYPSDTSDAEWSLLAPLLPAPAWQSGRGGRPEAHCRRAVVDAIRYVVHNGCVWRAVPADFPPWRTVYGLFQRWNVTGVTIALHAANADIGVAKAALFPTISLTGLAGSLSAPLGNLFKASTAEWSAAAGVVQPLLDPQRSIYQVELADARKREALFQYQKTVQTAFQEVADALLAYAKNAEFERELVAQVEALRRAEGIALSRYRVGYASYFDVINADRDLFAAELTLSAAYANNLTALVRLYQVLGGGWQDVPAS